MKYVPEVSIGIVVYNGEKHLRDALDSLLAQTYTDFELIISDNASFDETFDICQIYVAKDSRVRYVRHEENRGAIWNFNFVVSQAKSNYFMWASHDDYWHPSYLQTCLGVLKDFPSVIVAGSACDCTDVLMSSQFIDVGINTVGLKPLERFKLYKKTLSNPKNMCALFYGVYRLKSLSKALPLRKVFSFDHIVLAQLALSGEFFTVQKVLMRKRGGGDSASLERTARSIFVKNPLLIRHPHLIREITLQSIILKSDYLDIVDKALLSCWSLFDFFRCFLFNRTKALCQRIKS